MERLRKMKKGKRTPKTDGYAFYYRVWNDMHEHPYASFKKEGYAKIINDLDSVDPADNAWRVVSIWEFQAEKDMKFHEGIKLPK